MVPRARLSHPRIAIWGGGQVSGLGFQRFFRFLKSANLPNLAFFQEVSFAEGGLVAELRIVNENPGAGLVSW